MASIVTPDTGLVEEDPVMLLVPSFVFENTPVAVPLALKPSEIFVIAPVKDLALVLPVSIILSVVCS